MVCINNNKNHQRGSGVMDSIMKKFTVEKYPGEHHARSLAPQTFGKPMGYMGPGTRLDIRLDANEQPKPDSQPINHADFASYKHDLAYKHAYDNYVKNPTSENKKQQMQKVWKADDEFIDEMNQDTDEPMAPIAGKLIQLKKTGEQLGVLPTTKFSGFGLDTESERSDPVYRLRQLVQEKYKNEEKTERKMIKSQQGGVAFLPAMAVAAASALAAKLTDSLYDWIKGKIQGHGIKVKHHKTKQQRIKYLKDFINSI